MAFSIANMLLVLVVLLILMPVAVGYAATFVPSTNTTSEGFSSIYSNTSSSFNNSIIEPLVGSVSLSSNGINQSGYIIKGLNYTANPFASSAQLGFSFAFIVPGTIYIMETMLSMPLLIGRFLAFGISVGDPALTGTTANGIALTITAFLYLVITVTFVSVISKYPILQG